MPCIEEEDHTIREPGWWLAVDKMVMGWKELKGMSPADLTRYCGGKS